MTSLSSNWPSALESASNLSPDFSKADTKRSEECLLSLNNRVKFLESYNYELELAQNDLKSELLELRIRAAELEARSSEMTTICGELEDSFSQHHAMFKTAPIGIICVSEEGYIECVNFAGTRVLDAPTSVLKNTFFGSYLINDDRIRFLKHLSEVLKSTVSKEIQMTLTSYQKQARPIVLHSSSFTSGSNGKRQAQLAIIDISAQQDAEEQLRSAKDYLEKLAHYDALTNLPNRTYFQEALRAALVRSRKFRYQTAVLFIDLDGFKPVNDRHGHVMGDLLLVELANRLRGFTREQNTVARLGGDVFTMILEDQADLASACQVAEEISERIREPVVIAGETLKVSSSIGVCLYPNQAKTPEALIKAADAAMYRAKDNDGNQVIAHNDKHSAAERLSRAIEAAIPNAIENDEFELLYQPMACANSQEITSVEALLRWHHPEFGLLMPDEFIGIAEKAGAISSIGNWVFETACQNAAEWAKQGVDLRTCVNVSGKQLESPGFAQYVMKLVSSLSLEPSQLELEVTESTAISQCSDVADMLLAFQEYGIHLAIDDFGTGYSSFARLIELPMSRIKLDRYFIQRLGTKHDSSAIVRSLIYMAHELKMGVVAEGVETQEQLDFLLEQGCDTVQGFLFSGALTSTEIVELYKSSGAVSL